MLDIMSKKEIDLKILSDSAVGIDESGNGCIFGSAFSGCVILNPKVPLHPFLNDSKKVTQKRRRVVFDWIKETCIAYSVGSVSSDEIDMMGIKKAIHLSYKRAVDKISEKIVIDEIYIDGGDFIPPLFFNNNDFVTVDCIPQGDSKIANIAAASIIAKVTHEEYINNMIIEHPHLNLYNLQSNQGYYGAKGIHVDALKKHGLSKWHRRTYNPCTDFL